MFIDASPAVQRLTNMVAIVCRAQGLQAARAARTEEPPAGCYFPERPEGAACDPTVALPYEPPELPAAMEDIQSKRYAITCRADWRIPTAFVMIKLQLRWIRSYFTSQFNAQRAGKPLAMRTVESEGSFPFAWLQPHLS